MRTGIALALLLAAVFAAVAFQPQEKAAKPVPTYSVHEAYAIYSAILPDEWTWRYARSKTLLIKAETVAYPMCLVPDAASDKQLEPAIADYRVVNRTAWTLERDFAINKPYQLVPAATLEAFFRVKGPAGWEDFNREHPDSIGWIEVSAVGFNQDKSVAVVYIGHSCGALCGGGGFRVLHKSDGKWQSLAWKGQSCAWAS